MVFGSLFIILAVGILAFAFITSGFYRVSTQKQIKEEQISDNELQDHYQQKLQWLRELEFEFKAEKIDAKDYERQKITLQAEAVETLKRIETLSNQPAENDSKKVEGLITDRRMERDERSAGFCVKCGRPIQSSDQFCPNCGMKRD